MTNQIFHIQTTSKSFHKSPISIHDHAEFHSPHLHPTFLADELGMKNPIARRFRPGGITGGFDPIASKIFDLTMVGPEPAGIRGTTGNMFQVAQGEQCQSGGVNEVGLPKKSS